MKVWIIGFMIFASSYHFSIVRWNKLLLDAAIPDNDLQAYIVKRIIYVLGMLMTVPYLMRFNKEMWQLMWLVLFSGEVYALLAATDNHSVMTRAKRKRKAQGLYDLQIGYKEKDELLIKYYKTKTYMHVAFMWVLITGRIVIGGFIKW